MTSKLLKHIAYFFGLLLLFAGVFVLSHFWPEVVFSILVAILVCMVLLCIWMMAGWLVEDN